MFDSYYFRGSECKNVFSMYSNLTLGLPCEYRRQKKKWFAQGFDSQTSKLYRFYVATHYVF